MFALPRVVPTAYPKKTQSAKTAISRAMHTMPGPTFYFLSLLGGNQRRFSLNFIHYPLLRLHHTHYSLYSYYFYCLCLLVFGIFGLALPCMFIFSYSDSNYRNSFFNYGFERQAFLFSTCCFFYLLH